jgi:Ras-related GTP-binding protein A/B
MVKKKVLLMGKAHSGKTSMRSIIFANYLARDTTRLSPTLDVEHHHVRFLGDLVLNLWDCGGQDAFYESYFERDRETIFRSVELLIYVFDIESESPEKDFDHFCGVLEAIEESSPDARIFVLVHKMDLVAEEDRMTILNDRKRLIADSCNSCGVEHFQCFGTSIWDETLYKAWSEIVTNLIPNISILETHLNNFCRICDADEVVLFERATFLVIAHAQAADENEDAAAAAAAQQDGRQWSDVPTTVSASGGAGVTAAAPGSSVLAPGTAAPADGTDQDEAKAVAGATSTILGAAGQPQDGSTGESNNTETTLDPSTGDSKPPVDASSNAAQTTHLALYAEQAPYVHLKRTPHFDAHRFEKISNIVKQFKLSCGKAQSQFQGMEVRNSRFRAFIDAFTANTYIMVIVSNPRVHTKATEWNIQNARNHFEKFIPRI